jgi:perosamine synthetase
MKINQFEPYIGQEEYGSIKDCFDSNWITEGPKSQEFVENLKELIGCKYAILAPNGTLALYLALRSLGIGPGDSVIVPNFTFIATANAVKMVGAIPVFVDVGPDLQLDPQKIIVDNTTKAIIPAHIFGFTANMEAICDIAEKHDLKIVEDAAQAIGIKRNGKHCGTFGDVGCFSFFADKTITTGEGGLVVSDDEKVYDELLYLRNQGRKNRGSFYHEKVGYNFRMTDIQAAIGLVQLKKLPDIIKKKQQIYKWYQEGLSQINQVSVYSPDKATDPFIPFRVVISVEGPAEDIMNHMKLNDIEPRGFFYPLHKQPCYMNNNYLPTDSNVSISIDAYEHGVCLPSFVSITKDQVGYVCRKIREFFDHE